MEPSEKETQNLILHYLNLKGHYCWRNNTGMFFGEYKGKKWATKVGIKGSSDIIGVDKNGRGLAIEVKKKGGKTSPEQDLFLKQIKDRGGVALVAYSLDDVINAGL